MNKFENIKVGDTVYLSETVKTGFSSGKSFFVPFKVIRVSNTQFTVEGGLRFKKERGQQIGNYGDCYNLGDDFGYMSAKRTVSDQSKECDEFKSIVSTVYKNGNRLEELSRKRNYDSDLKTVTEISELITKIELLITPKNK